MNNFLKSWPENGTNQKTPPIWVYNSLIFFKIRPSLTTSREGLKRLKIHVETTRILVLNSDGLIGIPDYGQDW